MGVVYKLTEDVVRFIVDRKGSEPRLSCREIAELVGGQYQKVVSKSSVHDVLKEHGIAIPRGRKPRVKFQIPPEKKQQLFANVPPIVASRPASAPSPTLPIAKIQERAGEIFIQAAFWDIFPRPLWGLKRFEDLRSLSISDLRAEWEYVSTPVERFRIELEDGSFFEIDSRFQSLGSTISAGLPAGIERSTQEAADLFLNNVQPLCIRSVGEGMPEAAILDFVHACEGSPGKGMTSVSLLGKNGISLTQFSCFPRQKKRFMIGITEKSKVEYKSIEMRIIEHIVSESNIKNAIISNIIPCIADNEVLRMFQDRHPPTPLNMSALQDDQSTSMDISDQPAWILARLKARALTFFPSGFGQDALAAVLALRGSLRQDRVIKDVTLLMPASYAFSSHLGQAADDINALNIRDENGLRIVCKVASENNANF